MRLSVDTSICQQKKIHGEVIFIKTRIKNYLENKGLLKHQPPVFIPFRNEIILSMKRPVEIEKIKSSLTRKMSRFSQKEVEKLNQAIDYLIGKRKRKDASNLFVAGLRAFLSFDRRKGALYGLSRVYEIPDSRAVKSLVEALQREKIKSDIPRLLDLVGPSPWKVRIESSLTLLEFQNTQQRKENDIIIKNKAINSKVFTPQEIPPELVLGTNAIDKIKVACILDEFSFLAFNHQANFLQLSVDNYIQELTDFDPDFIFFESAWRGKDDLWGSKLGHIDIEVIEILEWGKKNSKPTVFWNKEDPVHFKSFLNLAKLTNYVFTTDISCIQSYKKILGHNRVYLLPFAVEPKMHNPIEEFKRISKLCFAGAYYKKYQQRNEDMINILNGISDKLDFDIYDRNFYVDDEDYNFPESFDKNIIGNLKFEDVNLAYKGYDYALNLNSIKNSQTMFARRVFELIASNTMILSNYSRGIKLFFGDIILCSDSGQEILDKLSSLSEYEKDIVKLIGIRKVLSEHTYEHRFRYIVEKISSNFNPKLKSVLVVSLVSNSKESDEVISNFLNQDYANKYLKLISIDHFSNGNHSNMEMITVENLEEHFFEEFSTEFDYVSYFNPSCEYGRFYLTDLTNAMKYSNGLAVSKIPPIDEGLELSQKNRFREEASTIPSFALFPPQQIMNKPILPSLENWKNFDKIDIHSIVTDEFEIGTKHSNHLALLSNLDTGLDFAEIVNVSDDITQDELENSGDYFSSAEIFQQICDSNRDRVNVEFVNGKTVISSDLKQGEHTYLYWHDFMKPEDIGITDNTGSLYLDCSPGLRIMIAIIYYDSEREKLGSSLTLANSNASLEVPNGTEEIRLALRLYQQGNSIINSLDLFKHNLTPQKIITSNKILIVSNNYPSYQEKYRNGFLHSRVQKYKKAGVETDVFILKSGQATNFREYEGIQVIEGSNKALENTLKCGSHEKILIHFLDKEMWDVISKYEKSCEILVWIHGSEIQPWHRRKFNHITKEDERKAKLESKPRMEFWRGLFSNLPNNIKFIFVSQYFAEEVMEDTGIILEKKHFEIIHNPIDTENFNYIEKPVEQRKKILSIRPFASNKYANDMTVKSILELSKTKIFDDLEFLIIGDGRLFDEILEPLRKFSNVTIQRGFLSHKEIASIHKQYGIFLTPTRMDSQGVSRDEAMSSGLVPVTTNITAVPEFVDENCGILTPPEDYKAMAEGVIRMYNHPEQFLSMSNNASIRIKNQTDSNLIIESELKMIRGE